LGHLVHDASIWCKVRSIRRLEDVVSNVSDLEAGIGLDAREAAILQLAAHAAFRAVADELEVSKDACKSKPMLPCQRRSKHKLRTWSAPAMSFIPPDDDDDATASPCSPDAEPVMRMITTRTDAKRATENLERLPSNKRMQEEPPIAAIKEEMLEWSRKVALHGPCSTVFGGMPMATSALQYQQVSRKDAHCCEDAPEADSGACAQVDDVVHRTFRRIDTVGQESLAGKSRATLVHRVRSDDITPCTINAGQTGTVYSLEDGGEKIAVFKPAEGESFARQSLNAGEGCVREEVVYLVDRLTDSRAGVPVTSRASLEVDGRIRHGAVQAFFGDTIGFIEDFAMPRQLGKAKEFVTQDAAEALAVLDMRVMNTDRHSGNLLLLHQSKPHGLGPIDHGCCLPPWWQLGESNFEAWIDWPQLQCPPTEATRDLVAMAFDRLPWTCDLAREAGLPESAIITLKICTLLVKVAIDELQLPCGSVAALMLRDAETGFTELSWLESKVFAAAEQAGIPCQMGFNHRGDKQILVEEDTYDEEQAQAIVESLEETFRADLGKAASPARP